MGKIARGASRLLAAASSTRSRSEVAVGMNVSSLTATLIHSSVRVRIELRIRPPQVGCQSIDRAEYITRRPSPSSTSNATRSSPTPSARRWKSAAGESSRAHPVVDAPLSPSARK